MNKRKLRRVAIVALVLVLLCNTLGVQAETGAPAVTVSSYEELVNAIDQASNLDTILIEAVIWIPEGASLGDSSKTVILKSSGGYMEIVENTQSEEITSFTGLIFDGAGKELLAPYLRITGAVSITGCTFKNCGVNGAINMSYASCTIKNSSFKDNKNDYGAHILIGYKSTADISNSNGTRITTVAIRNIYKKITDNLEVNKGVVKQDIVKWLNELKATLSDTSVNEKIQKDLDKLERKRTKLLEAYLEDFISKDDYKAKYEAIEGQIEEKKKLLVPVEENEDIKVIESVLQNIDDEIDAYVKTLDMEESKVDFLIEHTKRITVLENRDIIIELDLVAGAIIAGKDFLLYVHDTMTVKMCQRLFFYGKTLVRRKNNGYNPSYNQSRWLYQISYKI